LSRGMPAIASEQWELADADFNRIFELNRVVVLFDARVVDAVELHGDVFHPLARRQCVADPACVLDTARAVEALDVQHRETVEKSARECAGRQLALREVEALREA